METIPKWRSISFLMKTDYWHKTTTVWWQTFWFLMTLETSATGRLATNFQGKLVDDIRKRKGLPTDEKVVKDATKQRTVTRVLVLLYEWWLITLLTYALFLLNWSWWNWWYVVQFFNTVENQRVISTQGLDRVVPDMVHVCFGGKPWGMKWSDRKR